MFGCVCVFNYVCIFRKKQTQMKFIIKRKKMNQSQNQQEERYTELDFGNRREKEKK